MGNKNYMIENIILNFYYIKIDKLWSNLNCEKINMDIKKYSNRSISVDKYVSALVADVLDDDPKKSLKIIKSIKDYKKNKYLQYREMYLNLRIGNRKEALEILYSKNIKNSDLILKIIERITSDITLTKTILYTSAVYGVHEHFSHLEGLIRQNKFKQGVEVGVFMGFHSGHLLEASRTIKLWGVDVYKVLPGAGYDNMTNQYFQNLYNEVNEKLSYSRRFSIIRKPSIQAAKKFQNNQLDFVYLDADHRYSAIKSDLIAWTPKVKEGGIISGHDYGAEWPGVKQAVDEWSKKNNKNIHLLSGTFWYAYN